MAQRSPLRLGILSTAWIGTIISHAAAAVPEIEVVAIASRTADKAENFAKTYNIPKTCTYEAMLSDSNIEAIYIPLPTALATAWAVRAADAGKHVLVDKPFDSASGVHEIISSCHRAGVAFLDGTHFVHSKRIHMVRESIQALDPGASARRIVSSFSFPIFPDSSTAIRADPSLEPMGGLGDLGWYNCRVAVALLGANVCEHIKHVRCVAALHPKYPVIGKAEGVVSFENGSSLVFDCDMTGPVRQRVEAVTTTGTVRVNDFVLSENRHNVFDDIRPPDVPMDRDRYEVETTTKLSNGGQMSTAIWPVREEVMVEEKGRPAEDMLRNFVQLARKGQSADNLELRRRWERETIATQTILDALFMEARRTL